MKPSVSYPRWTPKTWMDGSLRGHVSPPFAARTVLTRRGVHCTRALKVRYGIWRPYLFYKSQRSMTWIRSGEFRGQLLNLQCHLSGPDRCVRTGTGEPGTYVYLYRYLIRGVTGALSHSARIKTKHLLFQAHLNEPINNLRCIRSHRRTFGGRRLRSADKTWVISLMKETMAPTSGLSLTSPSKSPRLSVLEAFTIALTLLLEKTPSDGARNLEAPH